MGEREMLGKEKIDEEVKLMKIRERLSKLWLEGLTFNITPH